MPSALILGCAECVWDDIEQAKKLFTPDAVFAVKDMMVYYPDRIDYGICLHPERIEGYKRQRVTVLKRPWDFEVWGHKRHKDINRHTVDWGGSSGLLAIKVAMQEGFDTIVCAGTPMERGDGHVRRKEPWLSADIFRNGWIKHQKTIQPFVRSMSGWTKTLLGAPSEEWFRQADSRAQLLGRGLRVNPK